MTEEPMLCLGCREMRPLVDNTRPEILGGLLPRAIYPVCESVCLNCWKYLVNRGGIEFAQKYARRLYENWNRSFGLGLK